MEEKLKKALADLRKRTSFIPETAITLGSGLGGFAEEVENPLFINYSDIPGFPVSTAPGHRGRFVFGYLGKVPVAVMQGRLHYYEGHDVSEVVLPLRLLRLLGAKILLLTNAAGAIDPSFQPGEFMLVEDHISSFVPSPLRGKNPDYLGERFPDMSCVYDPALRKTADAIALAENIPLRHGVLVQTAGPNFETPAEIRMLKTLGADAVCMSTVIEAIAAKHCRYKIAAISCISNLAAGVSGQPLSGQEVFDTANRAAPLFRKLLKRLAETAGSTL